MKHSLLTLEELQKVLKIKGWIGKVISKSVMKLLKIDKMNEYYDEVYDDNVLVFIDQALGKVGNRVVISENDLISIPKTGPVVCLFNHPYGGVDALAAIKSILSVRNDVKFVANFLIGRIKPLEPYIFKVNPFENINSAQLSLSNLRDMYKHIEQGKMVCIFPAGEVSTRYGKSKRVEDKEWHNGTMKFIQKVNVPVISARISGENSKLFHRLGKIHPLLRSLRLPSEFLNKRNLDIQIRYSKPAYPRTFQSVKTSQELAKVLRAKTYCLDMMDSKKEILARNNWKQLIPAVDKELLIQDVDKIKETNLLFSSRNFMCFLVTYDEIPNVFTEISRLREVTFREIGEGTGLDKDTDKYDKYYKHLFIWNDDEAEIVGAYRVGFGEFIMDNYGVDGFYISSLFKIEEEFYDTLRNSFEMGRSFVVSKYQKSVLSLFLLWKGIYQITILYPEYKYLIGPTSISADFEDNVKILLVEFLKRNYKSPRYNIAVKSTTPYLYELNDNHEALLKNYGKSINSMDKLLSDLSEKGLRVPILFKKYLQLGGKVLAFNVDPDFNFVVDGLVIVDIGNVSKNMLELLRNK